MTNALLDHPQLRAKGFEVLTQSLGWVNAVRFIQQYESSSLNYVHERDSLLPALSADDMLRELDHLSNKSRPPQL